MPKRDPIHVAADELEPKMASMAFFSLLKAREEVSIEELAAIISNKRLVNITVAEHLKPIGVLHDKIRERGRVIGSRKVKAIRRG